MRIVKNNHCVHGKFPCRHSVDDEIHRRKVSSVLGIREEAIPRQSSMAYDQIVQSIAEGKIKGLWVIATNSSHSWIHQDHFNNVASKLDFLVVQDMYPTTETAQRADLYFPAAGWGEKEGTLINSERRIGLVKKSDGRQGGRFPIFIFAN
jgi:assimilatory nitrate reductase catalytic subunit